MSVHRLPDAGRHQLPGLGRAFWALCGATVLAFIFIAALGAIDPTEAVEVTAVVVILATLWLAHEWRRQWSVERGGRRPRSG